MYPPNSTLANEDFGKALMFHVIPACMSEEVAANVKIFDLSVLWNWIGPSFPTLLDKVV